MTIRIDEALDAALEDAFDDAFDRAVPSPAGSSAASSSSAVLLFVCRAVISFCSLGGPGGSLAVRRLDDLFAFASCLSCLDYRTVI